MSRSSQLVEPPGHAAPSFFGPGGHAWPLPVRRRADVAPIAVALVAALALRWWLVPLRWVNPDEGAHLMDGQLVLHGLTPFVDFAARQVGYSYFLAALVRLFGQDLFAIRGCFAALTVATAWLVARIAGRLYGEDAELPAALIAAFLPLGVIWAPIVHTQPVTTFLCTLGVYGVVRHLVDDHPVPLVLGGVAFGLAFYVRESTLGGLAGIALALAAFSLHNPAHLVRRWGYLLLGFLVPCLLVMLWYVPRYSLGWWWTSPLNPVAILLRQLPNAAPAGTFSSAAAGTTPADTATLQAATADITAFVRQPPATTLHYLRDVVALAAGGIATAMVALLFMLQRRPLSGLWPERRVRPELVPLAWLLGLLPLYAYWSIRRGFFPQYIEEFLPPAAVLLGGVVQELASRWRTKRRAGELTLIAAVLLGACFAAGKLAGFDPPTYVFVVGPALFLAALVLPPDVRRREWVPLAVSVVLALAIASAGLGLPKEVRRLVHALVLAGLLLWFWHTARSTHLAIDLTTFIASAMLVGAFGYAFARAGRQLDVRYETVWAPETLRTVTEFLRARGGPNDRAISGGMIWEFAGRIRPAADITHPLGFILAVDRDTERRLRLELAARPPRFVVLDGYTERTYGRAIPNFRAWSSAAYAPALHVEGSYYPVDILERTTP